MTNWGASLWSTVSPPRTTSARIPAMSPHDRAMRSRRRGRRRHTARTTRAIPTVIRTLTRRFPNSTHAWNCNGATTLVEVHAGQSLQPRPEPVSRTVPPLTMPTAKAMTERAALCRQNLGPADNDHPRRRASSNRDIKRRC